MVQKLEISGVHMTVGDELRKYVLRKIGKLDKYIPKHARESVHAEVKLEERNHRGKQERICEVIIHMPKETIMLKETTINIYAAIDIVEEKLKLRLRKYKELHDVPHLRQRLAARFRRQHHAAAEQL
ncbi:MAG TPA: ribosome-associated translation inhibitor RaiA [Candidatus Saccharimonadales bacterium]